MVAGAYTALLGLKVLFLLYLVGTCCVSRVSGKLSPRTVTVCLPLVCLIVSVRFTAVLVNFH